MNYADFNTLPAGFPLESDATLGFMQANILDVLTGLAGMMGEGLLAPVVLSGCIVTGSTMSDGWVLHTDGEIYFFEGGTVQATAIIEQTTVSKSNQDGTSVPRYYTRKIKFGTGAGQFAANLIRRGNIASNLDRMSSVATAGEGDSDGWVIIQGLNTISDGAGGIQSGLAMYNGEPVSASSYGSAVSSGSPIYLKTDGTWTASAGGGALQFNPYTNKHLRTYYRKKLHPIGSLLFIKIGATELTTFFPSGGLGVTEWEGWALANGSNGTVDLTTSPPIAGFQAIQRIP